jgi:hypothetical protein
MRVTFHLGFVEAKQLNTGNLKEIADWCGGDIKGIRLSAAEQEVEFNEFGQEQRAQVGDWIVRLGSKGGRMIYLKVPPEYMPFIFKEHHDG